MNRSNLHDKSITHISIERFKSIRELKRFQLGQITVLAGANGAGKSNLLSFFRLLSNLANNRLDRYLALNGIDNFLHNGPEESEHMTFEIHFGTGEAYRLNIAAGARKDFFIENEEILEGGSRKWELLSRHALFEPKLTQEKNKTCRRISDIMRSWQMYHLQNTSTMSPMRRRRSIYHYERLEYDGSNLAPFLLHLSKRHEDSYNEIQSAIRLVAPFFGGFSFHIEGEKSDPIVELLWYDKRSASRMNTQHLSDGTLRFICLATALLQPDLPTTMIIDEPELGLHPEALGILSELIEDASRSTQMIVATHSPLLMDQFAVDDIVVVSRNDGQSVFERLNCNDFEHWLDDYSVGELWVKNVIEGGTRYE